ncbi:MAG: hypothetical protein WCO00_06730 [Rhodospirillaceae bacterium]
MELAVILKKSTALSKFQVGATPKQQNADPVQHRRGRFIEGVQHQIEALEAELANRPFVRSGVRKDKESGQPVERALKFKKWWSKDGNRYVVVLRYGASALFPEAIIAPTVEDVITVLDGVIEAAKAGDLDAQLATIKRSKKSGKEVAEKGQRR